jgi:TPR repeat protein
MKKLILPILSASILFGASNTTDLDKIMIELNNHNYNKAIYQLKKLPSSQKIDFLIGKAYFDKQRTITDYKFALKYLKKSNSPKAYYYIAKIYANGLGVDKNIQKAINYFRMSNTKESNYALAMLYINGKVLLKNPRLALSLLKKSAKLGYPEAQFELGKLYLGNNEIVEQNLEEASKWLYLSVHNHNFKEAQKLWDKYQLYRYQ